MTDPRQTRTARSSRRPPDHLPTTETPRLSAAPLRLRDIRITAGLRDRDGIAVLASEPGHPPEREVLVWGYGTGGERLAAELAARVRAWDRMGRPGEGLRVDAYPKSTLDRDLGDRVVVDKKHNLLALSWPGHTAGGSLGV